jgi:hypothetical protein
MNQLKASFDEVMREKKFIRYEVDVYARQKGAEITTIDFSLLPVLDPQDKNKVVHVVAEGRDIMEKKKAEAEIVRKNQELQELYDKIKVSFMKSSLRYFRSINLFATIQLLPFLPRSGITRQFSRVLTLHTAKILI